MTLTLTTHICFSPGRVCHCFTVLPVEGFLPASLLDLSSGVSQHYWPLLCLFELCLLFFSSEKQTRIIQAFLPCQVLHFCLHARRGVGVGAARCLLTHTPRAPAKSWHHPSAAARGIPFTQRRGDYHHLCPVPDVTL